MFLFGTVFEPRGVGDARLSRIESTWLGMVAGVQGIPRRAMVSWSGPGSYEQLLRMLIDAEEQLDVEIQPRRDERWGNPGLDAQAAATLF